jgi:hypothetical protein
MHQEWACIDTQTNEIHHYQTFMDGEILPVDIPHKNIAWRPLVCIHTTFNPDTHRELEPTITIHPDRVEKVYPLMELSHEEKTSRKRRKVREKFYGEQTKALTLLTLDLLNEMRVIQHKPQMDGDAFLDYLEKFL